MNESNKRYKFIWKWVNSEEDFDYLDSIKEVLEEIFYTGVCIDDLEYLKICKQRWNKTRNSWSARKSEQIIIYQKSKEDINRWYLRNENK